MDENVVVSLEELQILCREWQLRLRVQDWNIEVRIWRQSQFKDNTLDGNVQIWPDMKEAEIRVLDPPDAGDNRKWPFDMEKILVHEMLHILWDGVPNTSSQEAEIAINMTTDALLELKRERGRCKCDADAE